MLHIKAYLWKLRAALSGKKMQDGSDASQHSEVAIHPRTTFKFGRHLSFCVDDNSVQMAAVSHFGWRKRILNIRKVYIPNKLTETSARSDFIGQTIDEFLSEFGQQRTQVSVAISGKETAFRMFFMPVLKKSELDSAVAFEAQKQVPFPLEDCIFDYRPVYRVLSGKQARYKIALQASTRRLVESALEPFRQRNITVSSVHLVHDVIGQLLRHLPDFQENTHFTIIDFNRKESEISFYRGSNLEFFHINPTGSSSLGSQTEGDNFEYLSEALSTEIQASLDYYTGQYPRSSTDRIFVYGDLSYSNELLEFLNGHTELEFVRLPTERLDFVTNQKSPFVEALPVCLPVLASSACNAHMANLLPVADRLKLVTRKIDRLAQTSLILLAVMLIVGWAIMKQDTVIAHDNLAGLTRQVDGFKNSEGYHTYNMLKREITDYRSYIEKVKKLPSYLSLDFKELSLLTPSSIRLFDLAYEPEHPEKNFTIQGVVTSKDIPPEILLAEYVENLSSSPFFENVTLMRHIKKHITDGFEIEFQIDMRGIV